MSSGSQQCPPKIIPYEGPNKDKVQAYGYSRLVTTRKPKRTTVPVTIGSNPPGSVRGPPRNF